MKVRVGFGLGTTSTDGMDGGGFWAVVDACESLGWDSIWLSERITGDIPDAIAGLAAIAGRTRRLKFGTSVLVVPGRNPVLLAKELATIDALSGGRLVPAFGLGAGAHGEIEAFAVPRNERAVRTDEAVALMKRLWHEQDVSHQGRFFAVEHLTLKPRIAGPMDVWFGGHSPAALRRAGRLGDGWLPSFVSPSEYLALQAGVRAEADKAGREIEDEHFGALVPYVDAIDERADGILSLVQARRPGIDPRDLIVVGGDAVLTERLERFIDSGASKFVIVPVVPPHDWGEELARLRESVVRALEN